MPSFIAGVVIAAAIIVGTVFVLQANNEGAATATATAYTHVS